MLGAVENTEYLVDWAAADQKMLTADMKHCNKITENSTTLMSVGGFPFLLALALPALYNCKVSCKNSKG